MVRAIVKTHTNSPTVTALAYTDQRMTDLPPARGLVLQRDFPEVTGFSVSLTLIPWEKTPELHSESGIWKVTGGLCEREAAQAIADPRTSVTKVRRECLDGEKGRVRGAVSLDAMEDSFPGTEDVQWTTTGGEAARVQ